MSDSNSEQPARNALLLDASDISAARQLGLLRAEVTIGMDETNLKSFGLAYEKCVNLCAETYSSSTALQSRIREFAQRRGFAIRVSSTRFSKVKQEGNAKYICKVIRGQQQLQLGTIPACPFFVNVYGKNDAWKITQMQLCHDDHKFVGFQAQSFVEGNLGGNTVEFHQRDVSFASLLGLVEREMLPAYQENWANVTGRAVTQWLLSKQHEINRQMASRIKIAVHDRLRGDIVESYQKLEAYLRIVTSVNKGSHYGFEHEDGIFKRACFFPSACLSALKICKQIVGLDGTHLKGEMNKRGIYLVATTKDVNNHIIVFGMALVSVENYDNWHWFLVELKKAIGSDPFNPAFISDRQKGLLASVTAVFPAHRYCLRHIIGNIAKGGGVLSPEEIGSVRKKTAEYLRGINKEHWLTYALHEFYEDSSDEQFSTTRNCATYGELTSNLSEAANNWIGNDCRSSKPLHAFEGYMIKVVKLFAERRREAERDMSSSLYEVPAGVTSSGSFQPLVPVYQDKLEELLKVAKASEVLPCFVDIVMIRFADTSTRPGHTHVWRAVNLHERQCTCRVWQDSRFPCVHAIQAAIRHGTHISTLFDWDAFTVQSFKSTYRFQFVPVSATATLLRDEPLGIPDVQRHEDEMGSRGKKPGPKPKHKRKEPRVGSAASPYVAMTQ